MYPQVEIRQRAFENLKPYFVRKLKDRYTCCCISHVQMSFLKDAMNHMRSAAFGFHGKFCTCNCSLCNAEIEPSGCKAAENSFKSVTSAWESILCPKPSQCSFNALACIMGGCSKCGPHKVATCPLEYTFLDRKVPVKVFEDIEQGGVSDGRNKKRKSLTHKEVSCKDLHQMFIDHLVKFVKHNFVCRWQAEQFKECLLRFPEDVVVSVVDFAENYSFKEQNEIQSMHWHSTQVTIFVHITYFRIAGDVHKTIHFYVSDDTQHDTHFVQHYFMAHYEWLKSFCLPIQRHWVWSDGAASQFKSKRAFYFVSRYTVLTGLQMTWNFFGSGHGKGEHDGAGAVVKRALTQEQLKVDGRKLQCAADVVNFLRSTLSTAAESTYASQARDVSRVFWEVKVGEVNREKRWDVKAIPKTRSLHSVSGYSEGDPTALRTRLFSCFCTSCVQQLWRRCSNRSHVSVWEYIMLEPLVDGGSDESIENQGLIDATFEGHHDSLSDALVVGDNFAVNSDKENEENVDFYIIKCTKEKTLSKRPVKDGWGNVISPGSYVVTGIFYAKKTEHLYELCDTKPEVLIYSHLIRAIKFEMVLQDAEKLFLLSQDVNEAIYNSMPYEL